MPLVFFEREGKTLRMNAGINLRKLAKGSKISAYRGIKNLFHCCSFGRPCRACMVEVYAPYTMDINPRTAIEEKLLGNYTNPQLRLACQVRVHGNIRVKTQPVELMRLDRESVAPPLV